MMLNGHALPVFMASFWFGEVISQDAPYVLLIPLLKETITSNVYQFTSLTIPENIRVKR